jgi:hypothetical protein
MNGLRASVNGKVAPTVVDPQVGVLLSRVASTVANPSGNLALTVDESDSDDDGGAWTPVWF